MFLTEIAVKNRTSIAVLVIIIVFFGIASYITLPREAAPDVPIPYILVNTLYEGVSPEDIETSVTMKIETQLQGMSGLKELTSTSAEGSSMIVAEFFPDVEVNEALRRVKDHVDQARGELPPEAEDPVVTEINVAEFPIMMLSISGEGISPVRLKIIADRLEDEVEKLDGVLNAEVIGALEREIRLEIDPDRVALYGLTIPEILDLIPSENVNISAGGLETPITRFNIRVPAEFVDPAEVDKLLLTIRDGKPIYLTDVISVNNTFKDRESISRLNGKPSVTLSIQKRVGANILDISNAVEEILEEARRQAPLGVEFVLTTDFSEDIRSMVADLENNIAASLVLVVLVLMVFLGLRTSLIVALAIPLSMLMSFIVLTILGVTLNMIVLFSLILALGMLVDDAIVMVEVIYRYREHGYHPITAAIRGAKEVGLPIVTTTLTTIAAIFPLLFWPGIVGNFMMYLPLTVIITLSCSTFVALIVSPTICVIMGGKIKVKEEHDNWFTHGYRRFLQAALHHRFTTIMLVLLIMVGVTAIFIKRPAGVVFFPETDPARAMINIRMPQGTNIHETDRIAQMIEQHVLEKYGSHLEHVVTNVGSEGGRVLIGSSGGPHVGTITLQFWDFEDREIPSEQIIQSIRHDLRYVVGPDIHVTWDQSGPPTGAPVTVRIIGEDFGQLEAISVQAERLIADVPGLVNLRNELETGRPEIPFIVDRQRAAHSGLSTAVIGNYLRATQFGQKVGIYREYNEEYDITIRMPEHLRMDIDLLPLLRVPNREGQAVPLSSLGEFVYRGGFGTITRINQDRVATLTADAEERLANEVLDDVMAILSPEGRHIVMRNDIRDWNAFLTGIGGEGPVADRFEEKLSRSSRRLIARSMDQPVDDATREQILANVNRAIRNREFYNEQTMGHLPLGPEAMRLKNLGLENLSDDQIARFNRLVLEADMPHALAHAPKIDLPPGYEIRYAGEREEQDAASRFLGLTAMPAALLLILLILVAQFNTLSVPIIILSEVVLSLIGVMIGLLITGLPFSVIMTGIGIISLAGIVVKNGIVLLDYTRKLQADGMDVVSAAIQAGVVRLRPVLLTAATSILAMIPVLLGWSFDIHNFQWLWKSEASEWWRGMAVAVVFGLGFATLLTLVVVPCLYVWAFRFQEKFGFGGLKSEEELEAIRNS